MKHFWTILLSIIMLCGIATIAVFADSTVGAEETITVFGPERYERSTGKPDTQTSAFSIPDGVSDFTLRIQNGDTEGNHRVTSGTIILNDDTILGPSDLGQHVPSLERTVTLQQGNVLTVQLQGKPGSFLVVSIDGIPVTVAAPNVVGMARETAESTIASAGLATGTIASHYSDTVPEGNVISQDPPAGSSVRQGSTVNLVISLGYETVSVPSVIGMTQANAEATLSAISLTTGEIGTAYDNTVPAGQVASQSPAAGTTVPVGSAVSLTISLGPAMTTVPNLVGMSQSDAEAAITAENLSIGQVTSDYSNTFSAGTIISQNPAAGSSVAQGTAICLVVSLGQTQSTIPPDPATVAPPVDETVATTVAAGTEFLYSGPNPIQTGVAPGTIEVKRAAVLRGLVTDRDGNPLPGVTITILNHPEFGQTLSRDDGMFDMAVNGGGILTVNYRKDGFAPAQRQVNAPWNDFAWLSDVAMMPFDSQVTTINLASSMPIQVARGSVSTDADGTRQATMFFSQGTTAQMVMPDGTTQPLASLNVRATEYTVGPNGPKAMPAELPPTSAYTYAVELSADEAVAAGATEVRFDKPVYFYVENFLNFPVGGIVPAGYYDYGKAAWVPSDNGRIVKVVAINGGLAELDTDGSGQMADATKLSLLGITDTERQQLAALYAPGQSLWRVPVTHFTPWDCNWPWGLPPDAVAPDQPEPERTEPCEKPECKRGSVIECQNQTLGESIPITGTSFSLNYRSDRVRGRKTLQTIKIPLSGSTVPTSLTGIVLKIRVAGRTYEYVYPAAPNQAHEFTWDGLDIYGRRVYGTQKTLISIGYKYGIVQYSSPAEVERSFAKTGGVMMSVNAARTLSAEITLWQNTTTSLQAPDALKLGLGAWSLNVHHFYDVPGSTIHFGYGTSRKTDRKRTDGIISTVSIPIFQDGNTSFVVVPRDIAFGPDGNMYISHGSARRIQKLTPDGVMSVVAGSGFGPDYGDGGPATAADIGYVEDIDIGSDGSIYIADNYNVRKVSPDGIITSAVRLPQTPGGGINGVAVSPDGNLFFSTGKNIIYKNSPDGKLSIVAGGGNGGDGGPATSAKLIDPQGIAFGADGSYYFAESGTKRIRKVGPDGIISTIAGGNSLAEAPLYGDNGPATSAAFGYLIRISVSPDGSIYVADGGYDKVRRISPTGIITTVAGNGTCNTAYGNLGDGGLPTDAMLCGPMYAAIGPDGDLYIAEYGGGRVRRVSSTSFLLSDEFPIEAEDGIETYIFDNTGRHLRTVNTLTNATIYSFGYDSAGHLASITDGSDNITTIERDSNGNPVAIVSPYGQRSTFTVDSNSYLSSIANPAGETYHMTYTTDGLLTTFVEPKGNASQFTYDENGLLTRDQNAAGGFSELFSTRSTKSSHVTLSTALNRTTTYLTENLYNGQRRTVSRPSGATSVEFIGANGVTQSSLPDGTNLVVTKTPDPRFGMQAPLESTTIIVPSGSTATLVTTRSVTLANPYNQLSLISQTDTVNFNGRKYISVFDASTKQRTTTTPVGRQTITLLDNLGRTLSFNADPTLTAATFSYDTRGRLTLASQGNIQSTFAYDTLGRVSSITDASGNTVRYNYDLADRVTKLTLPSGRSYSFLYDANGNTTRITMPNGAAHDLGYTVIDLAKDYTPPANPAYSWDYNLDQDWTGSLLPSGRRVDAGYDDGGRPTALVYPEASIGYYYTDATDRVQGISRASSDGTVSQGLSFTYDGGLVTGNNFSGVANGNFAYTYDNNFFLNQIQLTSGSNSVVTPITRDDDGLVTGLGPFTFTRQGPAGATSQISDPALAITITHDSLGRLASRSHTVNGQNVYSLQLSYDVRGNISSKTETVSGTATTFDYTYDQDGQLVQVKKQGAIAENFAYDVNGNRTSYERPGQWTVTAGYDEQDRILQQGSVSYQFNADGQLAQRGSDAFLYSATGELLQSTANGDTIVYSYDGTGRRIARTDVSGTKQYLYSNLEQPFQLTAMRDTAGVLSYYYYDTNGHLFAFDKGDERFYVASDQLGTPKVVTDTTGTVVRQMEYDSYGMPTFDSNPAFEMPVGFAGGISDAKTGLVRFGYRDYEPETGRWTAKDPILFKGNQGNLYGYVSNDPINWIDPDGLQKWKVTNPEQHPGGQRHVHWGDDAKARNGGAVNEDGSTRHGCKPPRKVVDKIRALTGWALEDLGAMAPFFVLPGQQQMLDNLNNGMPIDHYPGKIY